MRHKFTKKRVTIVCIHLKAFEDFSEKRTEQTEFVLNVLKEHMLETDIESVKDQAVIICGDLNGNHTEDFYQLLVNDNLFNLRDVYSNKSEANSKKRPVVDYIFYTNKSLHLINYLESDVLKTNKKKTMEIPNLAYPSDHLSLICDFQIT